MATTTTTGQHLSFDAAWGEIASNLNSNPGHDLALLTDRAHAWYQSEEPIRTDMMNACWNQMLSILTEMSDGRAESPQYDIQAFFSDDYEIMSKSFEEMELSIQSNDTKEIKRKTERFITQIEELTGKGLFIDSDRFAYRSFMTPLEGIVWRAHSQDRRELIPCPFPFDMVYFYHALASHNLGLYEDAKKDLHKAIHWNPANANLWFELGENYKEIGQMDEFGQCVYSAYPYVMNSQGLARYHRDCGYYLIEDGDLHMAAAHLHAAIAIDKDTASQAWVELGYILERYGENYMTMTSQEAVDALVERSEPILGDATSINAVVNLMNQALSLGDYRTALMASSCAYELTNDDKMRNLSMAIMLAMNNGGKIVISEN